MENMICNSRETIEAMIPYIDKPVYVRGYCWGKRFDGWTVIYVDGSLGWLTKSTGDRNLVFDYRGHTYSVFGFLPYENMWLWGSKHGNAFYTSEVD